jgi:uncharacterized protein (DUF924 family)
MPRIRTYRTSRSRRLGRLREEAPAELVSIFDANLKAAIEHQEIIARFGRFPHRNRALGRDTSAEETQWFATAGRSFGQ